MGTTHRYSTRVAWTGSTGAGYDHYDRTHLALAAPAAVDLTLSADPAFSGDPRHLNPEQLVVLAAASCQLLSFLAVTARSRLDVTAYEDDAEAEMPDDDLPVRLTRIVLRPRITFASRISERRAQHLVEVAHRECYIANSLRTEVVIEPVFELPLESPRT